MPPFQKEEVCQTYLYHILVDITTWIQGDNKMASDKNSNSLIHSNQNEGKQLTPSVSQDMLMEVTSVTSEIDPQTGFGIDHVDLDESKFDQVTVKRINEDEIKIIATEEDGYQWEYSVEVEEKAAQVLRYHKPRRELEDDIQDALLASGYCIMGSDLDNIGGSNV